MSEPGSIKIFDLVDAPAEVRDGEDFLALRSMIEGTDTVLTLVVVGQYEGNGQESEAGTSPREVTYSEYLLHLWLQDSGAESGESVLLQWTGDDTGQPETPSQA